MQTSEKLKIMADTKKPILSYLEEQLKINTDSLKAYEDAQTPMSLELDVEIRRMREIEAIKLRDRIYELNRHIAVIKNM